MSKTDKPDPAPPMTDTTPRAAEQAVASPPMSLNQAFPALVLASITTGVMLAEGMFSQIHGAAEHILGHPVWTHEFAEKTVWSKLRDAIREHHPCLPFDKPENWQATRDEVLTRFPEPLAMPRGRSERTEDPIASAERIMGGRNGR